MSPRKTFATSVRVLSQLRHDPPTLGLVLVVPCLLITLLKFLFQGQPQMFRGFAPLTLAIFPLVMMFMVTSIATQRERTSGTLERLMTQPISKLDFIFGYALAFSILALLQACLTCFVILGLLDVPVMGGTIPVFISAVLSGFLGTAFGLLASVIAKSESQAVQMVMPMMMPQVLLSGLFVARDQMARPLQLLSDVFPLTYAVDAMRQIALHAAWTTTLTKDLVIVFACAVAALVLSSITIRR